LLSLTSQVVKGLYLGNIRDSEDHESLQRNGVTHILSIHNSAKPVLEDMTYLCISASDSSSQNLLQHFRECIRFIHECRLGGGACLVHCLAGVSRSTTVLVAYLMTVTELGWERCLAATRAVRSYVSPNFGFQQQLQEYEVTLLQEVHIRVPLCVCLQGLQAGMALLHAALCRDSCLPKMAFVCAIYYLGILGFCMQKQQQQKPLKRRECLGVV
uniref:Dual specificity protein phosphatase 22-A n=1 Tax=Melopsittacus undulatus TaxID=13146 RepID=A0A8V5GZR4_MELUD